MDTDKKLFSEFPPVSREEWEKIIKKDLHGADYKDKLNWKTGEGVEALPFYRRDDLGQMPDPLRTGSNYWEVRQPIVEPDITKANQIAKEAVKKGADSLQFLMEVRRTQGQIGGDLHGTAIQNQKAFDTLVEGINLPEIPLHFDSGLASPIVLAILHNNIETREIDPTAVIGSVLFDPYTFIIQNGKLTQSADFPVEESRQMVEFCQKHLPGVKCLGVNARPYHNAGATIVQEIGYALATGSEYLATLSEAGIGVDTIAKAIHFNFSIGSNYFLEIAKLRAARKLWHQILDAFGGDKSQRAYIHGSSSEWNKTLYDPYVNMLRTTTEGMSAAIAGCDSITIHPFNQTFKQPDDFSRRIARNSQIILKEEAYFDKVADPAAGSYYIETLTDKIAEAAWRCFQEVEQQGGMLKSIRGGYPQAAIEESRKERDRAIATRSQIFVGTNQYPNEEERSPREPHTAHSAVSLTQTKEEAEIESPRLLASIKQSLHNGAALGDLVPALFDFKMLEIRTIRLYRGAEAFEELRQITEEQEVTPWVLTLPLGNRKMRKARSSFATNFFGCVGYDITDPIGFESVEEAASNIEETQPDIVVLCSSDEEYEQLVPELCEAIDQLEQKPITVLAGYPEEHIEQYKEAGIDAFIHSKCDALQTLKDFHKKLELI